jgi:hypothetical protein
MTTPMLIYRLENLSMNYFVKDLFSTVPFITVVDQFPKLIMQVPTVSVVHGKLIEEEFEIGNRDPGKRTRRWFIDIFGSSISQRDDLAYSLLHASKSGFTVYDYNEGFPPDVSPTAINHLSPISRSYEPIDVIPLENEKLYYRGHLIFITINDKV